MDVFEVYVGWGSMVTVPARWAGLSSRIVTARICKLLHLDSTSLSEHTVPRKLARNLLPSVGPEGPAQEVYHALAPSLVICRQHS